jgi:hypothetical protein
MQRGPLILALLLAAASFSLAGELVTRDGVGPLEYAVGGVVLAVLVGAAALASLRALRRAAPS